jgi:hypothetical protein
VNRLGYSSGMVERDLRRSYNVYRYCRLDYVARRTCPFYHYTLELPKIVPKITPKSRLKGSMSNALAMS